MSASKFKGSDLASAVRLRPDMLWFAEIPPLSSYSPYAVSARARSLHGGKRFDPVIAITLAHLSKVGRGCERNPSCSRSSVKTPCLVPDDQVAIMPRHLAPSYFLFEHPPAELLFDAWDAKAPGCERRTSYYFTWGNATECYECLRCQRVFCQEFMFASRWSWLKVPFELRAFRTRLHPGAHAVARGICSDYGEPCVRLRNSSWSESERYWALPVTC